MKRKTVRMWAAWTKYGPRFFEARKSDSRFKAVMAGYRPEFRGRDGCEIIRVTVRPAPRKKRRKAVRK